MEVEMGYFDYLESKNMAIQKDTAFAQSYNKVSMWLTISSVTMLIINILIFSFVQVGTIVWLDILVVAGISVGIAGITFALKVRAMAKRKHDRNSLANFLAIWGVLFVLLELIILVINTWVYFT